MDGVLVKIYYFYSIPKLDCIVMLCVIQIMVNEPMPPGFC